MDTPKRIDIGCGRHKRKGFYGVDKFYFEGVDKVCDIDKGLPLKDNSVEEVYTSHFLEHVENLEFVFNELMRVCKHNAKMVIRVPHFSGRAAFFEFHRYFFRYGSFSSFEGGNKNMIPEGGAKIETTKRKLVFLRKPYLPLNGLVELLVDKYPRLATLYEETFLRNFFPAYEMIFEMRIIKE